MGSTPKTKGAGHGRFYKNVFWQYGLQVLKYLFPLVLVPYLTRVLGTESYAVYAYALSFMGVAQVVADFGFTLSGTKSITECGDDSATASRLVGNITAARFLLSCGLFGVVLCVAQFIPILHDNLAYTVLAFLSVVLRAMLPDFVFQGREQMGPLTTRYFASKGVTVLLTLLLVHAPEDLHLAAVADIAGGIVGLVWSFAATERLFSIGISKPSLAGSIHELKRSAIYCVSNISSSLFSGFTTIIVGLALKDNTEIAYWSLTLTTVNAVQALYTPISNSLYPHMLTSRDFRFARRLALLAAPALIVGTVAYCLLAEPILLVLGGEEYVSGAYVMVDISPVLIFSFYSILVGWPVLGAMGYVRELTLSTIVAGMANVIALLVLYLLGLASIEVICLVRWLADFVLLCARLIALRIVLTKDSVASAPLREE